MYIKYKLMYFIKRKFPQLQRSYQQRLKTPFSSLSSLSSSFSLLKRVFSPFLSFPFFIVLYSLAYEEKNESISSPFNYRRGTPFSSLFFLSISFLFPSQFLPSLIFVLRWRCKKNTQEMSMESKNEVWLLVQVYTCIPWQGDG